MRTAPGMRPSWIAWLTVASSAGDPANVCANAAVAIVAQISNLIHFHYTRRRRQGRDAFLSAFIVFFQVQVREIRGQTATQQQRQKNPAPLQRPAVPRLLTLRRKVCRARKSYCSPAPKHQPHVPRQQVEMALSAHLAPERVDSDQCDQKDRRIGETKSGHVVGDSSL